jgi:adenosylmethionine-8-amino-7-oxononanoate aminotransferase
MNSKELLHYDKKHVWHPFTQMLNAESPIPVIKGKDAVLYLENEKELIDAISSWWVNPFGHCNKRITAAVHKQMQELEHVIFAGFTHRPAVTLAKKLSELTNQHLQRTFFSDNGSTAVEVGLKMAIQYHFNTGKPRKKIISFQEAYHGDTFGAMAVGQKGTFFKPFEDFTFEVVQIPAPVIGKEEATVKQFKELVKDGEVAAFIFEPLVLGAGGMLMYNPEPLDKMIAFAQQNGTLCIADEVMTGFGRTGKTFATDYLTKTKPDIMSLSKCLTGGFLPMSVTLCTEKVFEAFYSEGHQNTFFHGHSYTANPLGCAAAVESMCILEEKETSDNLARINKQHTLFQQELSLLQQVENIRLRGTIIAFDVKSEGGTSYFNNIKEELTPKFIEAGVLLRPLGNTIYIMPPFCITNAQLQKVYAIIKQVLN